jgi:hypothetical protein
MTTWTRRWWQWVSWRPSLDLLPVFGERMWDSLDLTITTTTAVAWAGSSITRASDAQRVCDASPCPGRDAIGDPAVLRAELALVRERYNGVRLHAGIGYVTPSNEHEGRGLAIRKARQAGLEQARLQRLAWHREHRQSESPQEPGDVG